MATTGEYDDLYSEVSGRTVAVDAEKRVTAVAIRPEDTYDCSKCGKRDAVAELLVPGIEECAGYCIRCLGAALAAEQRQGDLLQWGGLAPSNI